MRQFPEVIRPLAMTLAGATVPQIVDEIAPLREYPVRHQGDWEHQQRIIRVIQWNKGRVE
jgi:hypothetical protein